MSFLPAAFARSGRTSILAGALASLPLLRLGDFPATDDMGKMTHVLPASGPLRMGRFVMFLLSVLPAAGFTASFFDSPLRPAPRPVHAPAPDTPPAAVLSPVTPIRMVPWQVRAAWLMQTSDTQPPRSMAKLGFRKQAPPGESFAPHLHQNR